MSKILQTRVQNKHDIKANWDKATNFIPLAGEIIIYDDLNQIKMGDGQTYLSELPFLDGKLKTVNGLEPDENGNIQLADAPTFTISGTTLIISNVIVKQPIAYAVYSADDSSLTFYNTPDTITEGQPYRGKTATEVYTGFETGPQQWSGKASSITSVTVADEGIAPVSTAYWFYNFTACTTMDLAKLDTSNVTSMEYMFQQCYALESITFGPNWNTENVTNMGRMFYYCPKLTELDVSGWNTQNVTGMSWMFYSCSALAELDVSGWNTQNVTDMYAMFYGCSALAELDVSGFNTSNVTNMGYMFSHCKALTELDVSGFNTSKVTDMNSMFEDCETLTELDVSNFNTTNVTDMYGMFNGCSKLTSVDVTGFNTQNVTNMGRMFYNCSKLIADCYEWNVDKVTDHTNFNFNASGVIVPYSWLPKTAYAVYSADDSSLTFYKTTDTITQGQIYKGKTATNVYTGFEDGSYPWSSKASSITSVTVADEGIAPTAMSSWFYDFRRCTAMDLAKLDTSNVTTMYCMFKNCYSLSTVGDLSGWNTQNVTNMREMFKGCSALTELDLSNFNTQNVTEMRFMFDSCSKLASVGDLSDWNTQNVTNMSRMFSTCNFLSTVGDISGWNTQNVTSMYQMFYVCLKLTANCSSWNVDKVTDHTDFNYSAPGVIAPTWTA